MRVLLFLNELSCGQETPRRHADEAMVGLVDLLRRARDLRTDLALVSHVSLKSVELATGYLLQEWIGAEPKNRDRFRAIRALQNRAPFRTTLPEGAMDEAEYQHEGQRADGLAGAHLTDNLAVSLAIDEKWKPAWLPTQRSILAESDDGGIDVHNEQVDVRHASQREHLDGPHADWIRTTGQDGLACGADIWQSWSDFFPHLTPLPRVEDDLIVLRHDWVRPVVGLLTKLEQSAGTWRPGRTHSPEWQTKVTGESDTRREHTQFADLDGVRRIFELHARFTPGAGRLHFRLVPEDGTLRIAYIGRKLGV